MHGHKTLGYAQLKFTLKLIQNHLTQHHIHSLCQRLKNYITTQTSSTLNTSLHDHARF